MVDNFFESDFFCRSKKMLVEIFFGLEKIFGRFFFSVEKKKLTEKNLVENFFESEKHFGRSKKILVDFFFRTRKNFRSKKVDRKFFGRKLCWSVEKKVEKFEKFVNFEVSLTFFVVDHSGGARAKRVSTVMPNSILLVDLRETNGEKCGPASRGVQFLSSRLHPAEIECLVQQQTLTGVRGQ